MTKYNEEKRKQLGMSLGAARNILFKSIMFDLVKKAGQDVCFRCGDKISDINTFSIEHKKPWLHDENAVELYFNLDNISFSHMKCNMAAARKTLAPCGSISAYTRGCRCEKCLRASADRTSEKYYKKRYGEHHLKGSTWLTNGIDNLKIKRGSPIPEGWRRGRTIPKRG